MYANDEPMQLATSYIPWSLAEGTLMAERYRARRDRLPPR
jgi:DNA-binding GntR family transcriptional regulator